MSTDVVAPRRAAWKRTTAGKVVRRNSQCLKSTWHRFEVGGTLKVVEGHSQRVCPLWHMCEVWETAESETIPINKNNTPVLVGEARDAFPGAGRGASRPGLVFVRYVLRQKEQRGKIRWRCGADGIDKHCDQDEEQHFFVLLEPFSHGKRYKKGKIGYEI